MQSDERIDKGVVLMNGHLERMKKEKIAKKVNVGECVVSRSVGRPRKRWIGTVKDCLRKVWMLDKQGEWCMMGAYRGGL